VEILKIELCSRVVLEGLRMGVDLAKLRTPDASESLAGGTPDNYVDG
jgi:hypothetical protein